MATRDTPFSSGASDDLLKLDVYEESSNDSVNKQVETAVNAVDLADRLKNDPDSVKEMTRRLGEKKIADITGKEDLLRRLSDLAGGNYSAFNALLPASLLLLVELYNELGDRKRVKVNNTYRNYSSKEYDKYVEATSLLDSVRIDNIEVDPEEPVDDNAIAVRDIGSETAIYIQAIRSYADLGDSESIAIAIARITDPVVKRDVYFGIMDSLVKSADLDNINAAVVFLGPEVILIKFPNIVADILLNYSIPADKFIGDYPTLAIQLKNLLVSLNPNWYKTIRDGVEIRILKPYMFMSEDALTLLQSDDIHRAACMIADSVTILNIVDVAKRYFPLAPI